MQISESSPPHPHYLPGIEITLTREELASLVLHNFAIMEVVLSGKTEEGIEEHKHKIIRIHIVPKSPV